MWRGSGDGRALFCLFFLGGGGDKGLGINFVLRWFRLTGVFAVDLF